MTLQTSMNLRNITLKEKQDIASYLYHFYKGKTVKLNYLNFTLYSYI